MTSGRNIWLAGICAASVLAAGLRLGDIVPGWVFRTLCTLALGTIWLRLGQQVWNRLRGREFGTDDVRDLLLGEYDVDAETAERDAQAWVARLKTCNLVEE